MNKDLEKILIDQEELQQRIAELGKEISRDYKGKDLLLICVLKGAVLFMSDLVQNIDIPLEMDFMAVSSYGNSTQSSGVVRILKDLDSSIEAVSYTHLDVYKRQVEVIPSHSLPVGILDEVNVDFTKRQLEDGDMIVMMTDGLLESNPFREDKEKWIMEELVLSLIHI